MYKSITFCYVRVLVQLVEIIILTMFGKFNVIHYQGC